MQTPAIEGKPPSAADKDTQQYAKIYFDSDEDEEDEGRNMCLGSGIRIHSLPEDKCLAFSIIFKLLFYVVISYI